MNEPELRQCGELSYRHPGDIDGEPREVAEASVIALAEVAAVAHEVARATFLQVRNAVLEEAGELTGSAVLEWEESYEGKQLAAIERAAEQVRRAAGIMRERQATRLQSGTVLET